MSAIDLWHRAADAMREDDDPRWHTVADWLEAEAQVSRGMEAMVNLLNVRMETQTGIKSYLRLKRRPNGELFLNADTNEAATTVALAYLGETPTREPEHTTTEEAPA
jgi:hypothetical protein